MGISKTISKYLDEDYLEYAMYVLEHRAIPSVIDGFKPTQRKIIYSANKIWKNPSARPYKVFQLTGYIAANAGYHHGDASLNVAIINMAQSFKNSMPLLEDIGQYGSLRAPEAGAPRYISTKIHPNFKVLYKDFELLTSMYDDGMEIEPKYFLPIIPTVLLNGSSGIAVGFATSILNRNPLDLIDICLNILQEKKKIVAPLPWYDDYSGEIVKVEDKQNSWIFKGSFDVVNTSTVHITELPPSMTYEKFDKYISDLEDNGLISSYENNCKSNIDYTIKMKRSSLKELIKRQRLVRFLKMEEKQTENLTVLDEFGKLKEFDNTVDLIKYFVNFRASKYIERIKYLEDKLNLELTHINNKARFIKFIIDGKIKVNNVKRDIIIKNLEHYNFDMIDSSYSYLLTMPIHSLTKEKYKELLQLEKDKQSELLDVKGYDPTKLYIDDLRALRSTINQQYKKKR